MKIHGGSVRGLQESMHLARARELQEYKRSRRLDCAVFEYAYKVLQESGRIQR